DTGVHMFATGASGPHGQVARELGVPQTWLVKDPSEALWMNEKGFSYLNQKLMSFPSFKENINAVLTGKLRIKIANTLRRSLKNLGFFGLLQEIRKLATGEERFIERYDDMVLRDFLLQFTDDENVHRAMNCLSMLLLVVPYTKSSAGEFIYVVSEIFKKGTLGVPKGGAVGVPHSFLRAFRRDGGLLKTGVMAKEIIVKDGKVRGVLGSDGVEYKADVVISNAGLKKTMELARLKNFPSEYVEYVKSLKLSYSWIATKIALCRKVMNLRAPSFFPIPRVEPEKIFTYCDEPGGLPGDPFLFVPIPTAWDKTLTSCGRELIICGVPTSNEVDQEERSQKMLDIAEEKLFSFFPEIEKNILWKSRITNKDTNKITRKGTGECIGLAQIPGQVGAKKPHPKTPVDGLFVVGCDAGARGVGTEQATLSGMLVANLVG
ncbi:MAG: hypothetical protein PHP64_08710, partial [Actinomycetota bacterium]|nr:hypothetical protein [Actinomycetota bacterium]